LARSQGSSKTGEGCYVKLSIVTTLYQSSSTITEFYRRVMAVAEPIADDIELIMVNDGSPDSSLDLALELHRADPRVVIVDLARNFGHHKAIMTGLSQATGDLVFLIDSDLEEEPEILSRFHERFSAGDCDVVYGIQGTRRGSPIERAIGSIFFSLIDKLSDQTIPRNIVTARLMTRQYVRALIRHLDREFMMIHLMQLAGFRQVGFEIRKLEQSQTTYSLGMRMEMAIKFLTTTSTKLLYLILYIGISIFGLSVAVIVFFAARYFSSGVGVSGFTSQIISIWFLGGLITLILGILGIYIANILAETKRRPYTVIRHVHRVKLADFELEAHKVDRMHALPGTVDAQHQSRFVAGQERS
jgi:putative glycosyltransferase